MSRGKLPMDRGILLVWIGVVLSYLVLEVNVRRTRYLLPVLPIALLFVFDFVHRSLLWTRARMPERVPVLQVMLPLFLVLLLWEPLVGDASFYRERWKRENLSHEIEAGQWIEATFPPERSVLYDAYAYVPPKFLKAVPTAIGQSYSMVNHLKPDLLVVREATASHYSDLGDISRTQLGKDLFLDSHYFYRYLRVGHLPVYRLARDFGTVSVYERTQAAQKGEQRSAPSWNELVMHLFSDQLYGQPLARETMGDIHFQLGLNDQAIREYGLAAELAPDYLPVVYKLGRAYLRSGSVDEAQVIIERLLTSMHSRPTMDLAEIRQSLGREYFQAGYFVEAIFEAKEAVALNPDLSSAHFDLALFYLVNQDYAQSNFAYIEAVRRFGRDAEAFERLQSLKAQGVESGEAGRLLKRYFE